MGVLTLIFTSASVTDVLGAGSAGVLAGFGISFTMDYIHEVRHGKIDKEVS